MTWTKRDSRDPLKVALQRESHTCAGCRFIGSVFGMRICDKTGKHAKKRCEKYKEQE